MKHTIFLLTIGLLLASALVAQKEEKEEKSVPAPSAAKAAFTKSFPGSSNEKWQKEGKDYEVNFEQNGEEMSAVLTMQGVLKETEVTIKSGNLPAAAAAYVKQHYKGAAIKEAAKITKANGEVNYEAEVNGKNVMFDKNGRYLKTDKD